MTNISFPLSGRRQLSSALAVLIIAGGIVLYFYYGVYKMLFAHFEVVGLDFYRGCLAAANFLEGRSIYDMPDWINPFSYFPAAVLLFIPFCRLSHPAAVMAWFLICHALILFTFFLMYKAGSRRDRLLSAAAASLALLFSGPLYQTLQTGNVNIIIFAGLSLIYVLILRGLAAPVPALLALFAALKLAPAALAAVFLKRKDWRALLVFSLSCLGLAVLSLMFFGFDNNLEFLKRLPGLGRYSGVFHGTSLTFVLKILLGDAHPGGVFAATMLFFAGLVWLWLRRARSCAVQDDRGAAAADLFIATIIMTLAAPSSWLMYCLFFAFPFYFITFAVLKGGHGLRWLPLAAMVFFVFSSWEVIYYQLPVPFVNLVVKDIVLDTAAWPFLSPALLSLHFLLDLALFFWALLNYEGLCRIVADFIPGAGAEKI